MSLLHSLSDRADRLLPAALTRALRLRYLAARAKLAAAERLVYGTFDVEGLRTHLEQKVGKDHEILMVHSSMNGLASAFDGTPLELVRMLIDYCEGKRTLVMPAFYFGDPDIGNVHATFAANPVCVLRRTPSQMGLATELFRRSKGVVQSRHPVYRVSALGPLAEELVAGHEDCLSPAGPGSPFEYMAKRDTMVIGIGKSFHVMTQAHHIESMMGDDFPVPRTAQETGDYTELTVVDRKQEVQVRLPRGGGFRWRFNIAKMPSLVPRSELDYWKFHNVLMFAGRAGPVTERLRQAALQGKTLYDPV